ncbi:MAG: hypothetical protein NC231_00170 [Bacillus sp. (in: Bacteria)]|nr:hypothetical protein [Bacillus sp. (in: firmicutes)]MCM1425083.1 hypothetical protein [Eubacterium sp.]
MLGKLMKYEWKATWKLLLPMNAFVVLMSILVFMTVQMSFFDSDSAFVMITGFVVVFTYILSMFVIAIGTVIYLIYRFYTSVYGDEGYLLHTLPVDKHHIIIAKTLINAAWLIINSIVIYCSVLFIFSSAEAEFMKMILVGIREYYVELMNDSDSITGFGVVMTYVASLLSVFARILKIMACASLGQMASNHKVLASFGFYYGIYFVQQIFGMFSLAILGLIYRAIGDSPIGLFSISWETELISGLIYCALFYFLTWYMMDKKLNLD